MYAWTLPLKLSVSFSSVISHRASPALRSPIHHSSLEWTPCHSSLQRFSLCFLEAKGGFVNKALLGLLFFSTPPPPFLFFFFSTLLLLSNHFAPRPLGLSLPSCRALKVFLFFHFFSRLSRPVPWRPGNKKENSTSNKKNPTVRGSMRQKTCKTAGEERIS